MTRLAAVRRTVLGLALALVVGSAVLAPHAATAAPESNATTAERALLADHWEGAFSRLGSIQQVALDLSAANGALAGTYDIPELGLFGEPLERIEATDSTLAFHLLYGTFTTHIHVAERQLTGANPEWGPPVSLHLRRVTREAGFDTVAVQIERAGATVRGTLYLPRQRTRAPAVVVAGGSTQTTRRPWEYRAWGPVLASRGIAALVYDRRGQGASSGPAVDPDLRDEAADVQAFVTRLGRRPEIDARRIGVMGLSRGGWVASWAAAHSPAVAFVVLECAPAVGVLEQDLQRIRASELGDSLTAADLRDAESFEREMMRAAFDSLPWPVAERACAGARTARWRSLVQIPDRPEDLAWWRRNEYDQGAVLARIRVPVLALFGTDDRIVPVADNAERMRAALAAGTPDVTLQIVPGVGHGLFASQRLLGDDWAWPRAYWVWAAKAPGVYEQVGDWLLSRSPRASR